MSRAHLIPKIMALTDVRATDLVPEIRLHLLPLGQPFEAFRSAIEPLCGLAPPYWAVAWPGGQAVARYLMDHAATVAGLRVADLGSGCGLGAIAAAMAGAREVTAVDIDPIAGDMARKNAELNGVSITSRTGEMEAIEAGAVDVVLAGDLWYEPVVARRSTVLMRALAARGVLVVAGDPGRARFPRTARQQLESYSIPASEELERQAFVETGVWRLLEAG